MEGVDTRVSLVIMAMAYFLQEIYNAPLKSSDSGKLPDIGCHL